VRRSLFSSLALYKTRGSYKGKELYAVVADVASYPQFIPFCTGSRIASSALVRAMQEKTEVDAELMVGFLSFKESYVSRVTCVPFKSVQVISKQIPPNLRACFDDVPVFVQAVASSSTPLFKALSTTWTFQSIGPKYSSTTSTAGHTSDSPGPTLVSFDLTYEFANPLHAGVSSAFFGQVSKLMITAFEDRCQRIYGPRSSA